MNIHHHRLTFPLELCPHGVDPFQKGKANKSIRLSITAHDGKALMGKVLLSFHHHTVEMELKGKDTSSSLCAAAVGRLQPLRETVMILTFNIS